VTRSPEHRSLLSGAEVSDLMRIAFNSRLHALLAAAALTLMLGLPSAARKGKVPADLSEILDHMNEASKHLKTIAANLEYTKVTVLVNDKSTETGELFFRKGKSTEIRIDIQKPDRKIILFRKNKAEIYLPKINQIQEYDLGQKSGLVQQFLLLGFGSDTGELKKAYNIKYLKEEDVDGDTTALLELLPRKENVAAQLAKIQIWISEDSWLPAQQKFFESGGDYLIARYTGMKVNRTLPGSRFALNAPESAKRVKMN
jgi:outer membrane lipoprotein-sorting protein